jgi:hypothetical protein
MSSVLEWPIGFLLCIGRVKQTVLDELVHQIEIYDGKAAFGTEFSFLFALKERLSTVRFYLRDD